MVSDNDGTANGEATRGATAFVPAVAANWGTGSGPLAAAKVSVFVVEGIGGPRSSREAESAIEFVGTGTTGSLIASGGKVLDRSGGGVTENRNGAGPMTGKKALDRRITTGTTSS